MTAYTGHAEPGGAAIQRTVSADGTDVQVAKLSVGGMDNNAYVLTDLATGSALLIDAADDPDRILSEIGARDLKHIVTTHGHRDHWQGLSALADMTDAQTWIHPDDADMVPVVATQEAGDGETVTFGNASVSLVHTPGHTPGSTCVVLGGLHLFTGDTLFPGGPGRTTKPEQFEQIMASLENKIFDRFDDDAWVYPGHGDDTTIGAERPKLGEWRARGW